MTRLGTRFAPLLLVAFVALAASVASSFSLSPASPSFRTKPVSRRNSWGGLLRPSQQERRRGPCVPSAVVAMAAGPATLEKEIVRTGGGPAVLERPETARKQRVDEPRKQRKGMGNEAWEVRIYNDGLNTREHVARSLVQVTGMSEMDAYQTMMQAHLNGLATVGRYIYEVAEMFHDALKKNGIVCDIVPVEED